MDSIKFKLKATVSIALEYIDRSTLAQKIVGEEEQDTSRRYVTIEAKELEVFLDKNSIEIFVNHGEATLTATFYLTVTAVLSKM